jgi:nicotinate-nucleotide pyrophosphorylase (carboxylating)
MDEIEIIENYIKEDVGSGDITSERVVPESATARGRVICKEDCTVAGIEEIMALLQKHGFECRALKRDGDPANSGDIIIEISGNARELLKLERVMLNVLGRMSGVATIARGMQDRVNAANPNIKLLETRKTMPGFRSLDKKAVRVVTGTNHRMGLWDMVLIKDNHLAVTPLKEAIKKAKGSEKVEVEVESADGAIKAAECGADIIMFDNMSKDAISRAIDTIKEKGLRDKIKLEVSGGITPQNIADYAVFDVDYISSGYMTKNARMIDFSLDFNV